MIDMRPLPMAFSQLPIKNPLTDFVDSIAGYQVWLFLQWYYAPYKLASKGDDVDQWIKAVSLNGARWNISNLCKP
jgi:hypothetical protein